MALQKLSPLWLVAALFASSYLSRVVALPATAQTADASLSGRLELSGNSSQLLARPIVVSVKLTNTGTAAISYWFAGPGDYPAAEHFKAIASGPDGRQRKIGPTNGQYIWGSGRGRAILPGTAEQVPLALGALPAGTWTIRCYCDEEYYVDQSGVRHVLWPAIAETAPITVNVAADVEGARAWDCQLLAKVRQSDSFATHLAITNHVDFVIDALIGDLVVQDPKLRETAVHSLFGVKLPRSAERAISQAIGSELIKAPNSDSQFLALLLALTWHFPHTDLMLDNVIAVGNGRFYPYDREQIRYQVAGALRYFPQKRAREVLQDFLSDGSQLVRQGAEGSLKNPWPPQPGDEAYYVAPYSSDAPHSSATVVAPGKKQRWISVSDVLSIAIIGTVLLLLAWIGYRRFRKGKRVRSHPP